MTDERHDKISRRAYELWEKDGGAHGRHDDHWHQAAGELDADAASPAPEPAETTALAGEPVDSPAAVTPGSVKPAVEVDPEPADRPVQTTAAEPLAPTPAKPAAKTSRARKSKPATKPA